MQYTTYAIHTCKQNKYKSIIRKYIYVDIFLQTHACKNVRTKLNTKHKFHTEICQVFKDSGNYVYVFTCGVEKKQIFFYYRCCFKKSVDG